MELRIICAVLIEFIQVLAASRIIKLPLTKSYQSAQPLELSLPRLSRLRRAIAETSDGYNLFGTPGAGYYVEVAIGTPPQVLNVLIDTGSSNFAVAASPQPQLNYTFYQANESSSYVYIGTDVYVPYTLGEWTGVLLKDVVALPSLPEEEGVLANIAAIEESENFFLNNSQWQGILGLGYPELSRPDSSVEPFLDTLFEQTGIERSFSLQLCGTSTLLPNSTDLPTHGHLVLGGVDDSLYTGDIQYTPVYKQWYYEVVLTDIKINGHSLDIHCKEYNFDKTIVDSGTTNLRLPSKVYDHFMREIKQNTMLFDDGYLTQPPPGFWLGTEMLCWDEGDAPWGSFPTVTLSLAYRSDRVFDLVVTPQHYLMLVETVEEAHTLQLCYKFAVARSDTGTVIGAVVMEGFFVVFDRERNKVGFAETSCPSIDSSAPKATVSAPYKVKYNKTNWAYLKAHSDHHTLAIALYIMFGSISIDNTTECAYLKTESDHHALAIALYVMLGVIVICMLPLVILFFYWQYHKHCRTVGGTARKCLGLDHTDQDNLLEATTAPSVR